MMPAPFHGVSGREVVRMLEIQHGSERFAFLVSRGSIPTLRAVGAAGSWSAYEPGRTRTRAQASSAQTDDHLGIAALFQLRV